MPFHPGNRISFDRNEHKDRIEKECNHAFGACLSFSRQVKAVFQRKRTSTHRSILAFFGFSVVKFNGGIQNHAPKSGHLFEMPLR
jgi:hypothetical protein